MTLNRKPISMDREKNINISSDVDKTNTQDRMKDFYNSNIGNKKNNINKRPTRMIRKEAKTNNVISGIGNKVSNTVSNTFANSNDTGVQATNTIFKFTKEGIVIGYKSGKQVYKKLRIAPKNTVNAVKTIKAMPSKIKSTVKAIPSTIRNAPRKTITNIKKGSVNVVKAIPSKSFNMATSIPRGIGKGIGRGVDSAVNSLADSDDLGTQSVGYTIKTAQNSVKLATTSIKTTKQGIKSTEKTIKTVSKAIMGALKLVVAKFIPIMIALMTIMMVVMLIYGVISAVVTLFNMDAREQFTQTELSILSVNEGVAHRRLTEALEEKQLRSVATPLTPNGYHKFYFRTSTGSYISLSEAHNDFINEEVITNMIAPIMHLIVLMDFDLDFECVELGNVDLYKKRNVAYGEQTFIRGARSNDSDKVEQTMNNVYYTNWEKSMVTFNDYVETVYYMIFDTIADIQTEELPTEWCNTSIDNETNKNYADVDCLNCSDLMYHNNDISYGLHSCDYSYYLCRGNHNVMVCGKDIHIHYDTCRGCGLTPHIHTDSCMGCNKEAHTHDGNVCYGWLDYGGFGLKCGKEAHEHSDSCNTCGLEPHEHTDDCNTCGKELHPYHDIDCYQMQYHSGQLVNDCGYADQYKGCNGYKVCLGHKVLALSLDYASLEELEQEHIYGRYEQMEHLDYNEAMRLKTYMELYYDVKEN